MDMDFMETENYRLEHRLRVFYSDGLGEIATGESIWDGIADRLESRAAQSQKLSSGNGKSATQGSASYDPTYRVGEQTLGQSRGTRLPDGIEPTDIARTSFPVWIAGTKRGRPGINLRANPALAAGLILVIGSVVLLLWALLGANRLNNAGPATPTPQPGRGVMPTLVPGLQNIPLTNPGFESGIEGWTESAGSELISQSIDRTMAHSGGASARLEQQSPGAHTGSVSQTLPAAPHLGKRIRFTAYVKADDVQGTANLKMYVEGASTTDGNNGPTFTFDDMQSRPITGTKDWQAYMVVIDMPAAGSDIVVSIALTGRGRIWVDDAKLEIVGSNVSATAMWDQQANSAPLNLDFEGGMAGWFQLSRSSPTSSTFSGTGSQAHSGQGAAYLSSEATGNEWAGALLQWVGPNPYAGKRVRMSAYLRTEDVQGRAGLQVQVMGQTTLPAAWADMVDRPVRGTTDWREYDTVLDISPGALLIQFGVELEGRGKVWIDDVRFEVVGDDVPLTRQP